MNEDIDPRFTYGLICDVQEVLERYGYQLPSAERERYLALADSMVAFLRLTDAYEGGKSP